MNRPAKNRLTVLCANALCAFALAVLLVAGRGAQADPLPSVGDTVETVTGTVDRTVSGAGETVGRTTGAIGKTVSGTARSVTDSPVVSAPGNLGRDLTQPVGILGSPVQQQSTNAQGTAPSGTVSPEAPNEYRPYDVYRNDLPDTLGRGTLARIYFEPGETTLTGGAENRIAGFAQTFAQRAGNVEIRGFADRSSGDDASANDLALRRAHVVQQALLDHGIGSGRVRASGMGNVGAGDAAEDRVDILFDGY